MSTTARIEHTPGPWELIWEDGKYGVIGATTDKKLVAIVGNNPHDGRNEIRKANAQLIAAAPELLDALTKAQQTIENAVMAGCDDPETMEYALEHHATLINIRAAIAKAKGETK
jgi:hypothetical protein